MADARTADFPDSHLTPPEDATLLGDAPASTILQISLYLKPRPGDAQAIAGADDPRAALAARRTAGHRDDIGRISAFANRHGLAVVSVEPARRLVKLRGSVAACEAAFGTRLALYRQGDRQFRARTGTLRLPLDLLPIVEAVLGLDDRPAAFARALPMTGAPVPTGHRPNQIGAFYDFPTGVTGAGQCIAIIEPAGGYRSDDLIKACQAMRISPPQMVDIEIGRAHV